MQFGFQAFYGRLIERDAMAQGHQEQAMENEKNSAAHPEPDSNAATPISIVEIRLTISVHDGLTLPDEAKAQIGSIWERFGWILVSSSLQANAGRATLVQ